MKLDDLVAGDSVFVDANILTFHAEPHAVFGPPCTGLLKRIERGELTGYASTHVLSEVAHRLMTIEAIQKFSWSVSGIAQRLRQYPAEIGKLSIFRTAVDEILQSPINVLTIPTSLIADAAVISQGVGLLSNDALIVALMQANGLTKIASIDPDFDHVPGLTRYAPP